MTKQTASQNKLTDEQVAEVLIEADDMMNQSLIGALWNTFRGVFVSASAGSTLLMNVATTEASVNKAEYRSKRLRELKAELAGA